MTSQMLKVVTYADFDRIAEKCKEGGLDFYTECAAEMFGTAVKDVSKAQRTFAKRRAFNWAYSAHLPRLQQITGVLPGTVSYEALEVRMLSSKD